MTGVIVALALVGCADFTRGAALDDDMTGGMGAESGAGGATPESDAGSAGMGAVDAGPIDTGPPDELRPTFAEDVLPLLVTGCKSCHSTSGNASGTGWVLRDDVDADLAETLPFIDDRAPASSRLLTKGAGAGHGGGRIYQVGSAEHTLMVTWIQEGAQP